MVAALITRHRTNFRPAEKFDRALLSHATHLFCIIAAKRVESNGARFTIRVQTCLATNRVVEGCEKLLEKVDSSSTFCNKLCTCCVFYRPKANLFCSNWRKSPVRRDCVILSNQKSTVEVSTLATCNNLICCKTGLNVGGKTHNTAAMFWNKLRDFVGRFTVA